MLQKLKTSTHQVNNSNLNISMKNHFAFLAGVRTQTFGHRNHALSEHVHVLRSLFVVTRVISPHVIDDFGRLGKARPITTRQFALESHVAVTGFQVTFGVLNISVAKVTSKFAFDGVVMPLGFEMILSAVSAFIPKILKCE